MSLLRVGSRASAYRAFLMKREIMNNILIVAGNSLTIGKAIKNKMQNGSSFIEAVIFSNVEW